MMFTSSSLLPYFNTSHQAGPARHIGNVAKVTGNVAKVTEIPVVVC
jgi:hypothetical protein